MATKKKAAVIETTPPKLYSIINLTPDKKDVTMPNGTNITLLAFKRGGSGHISEPLDYESLHPKFKEMLLKQVKRREIKIVEV